MKPKTNTHDIIGLRTSTNEGAQIMSGHKSKKIGIGENEQTPENMDNHENMKQKSESRILTINREFKGIVISKTLSITSCRRTPCPEISP